jgi:hypothetical protein
MLYNPKSTSNELQKFLKIDFPNITEKGRGLQNTKRTGVVRRLVRVSDERPGIYSERALCWFLVIWFLVLALFYSIKDQIFYLLSLNMLVMKTKKLASKVKTLSMLLT